MTMTLPYRRQQVTPRSGGRSAGDRRAAMDRAYGSATSGTNALATELAPTGTERSTPPRLRVAPPAPVTAPRAPFVAMMLVVVIAGVIGILVLNTKINENAFRLEALQRKQGSLDRTEQQLSQTLADKESPTSLAALAKQLGEAPADQVSYVRLPNGKQVPMPKPGTGTAKQAAGAKPGADKHTAGQPRN